MQEKKTIEKQLQEPFPLKDLEFRVAKAVKRRVLILTYITSRAVMERLDSVFGIEGWQERYQILETGVTCTLSVNINEKIISKQDAAPFTKIEPLKGAYADALKRAAVKYGIGRYLYQLPEYWQDLLDHKPEGKHSHYYSSDTVSGWWQNPVLPDWAVQGENQETFA